MAVTVTKVDSEWVVNFPISQEDFVILPADSTRTEPEEGIVRYGTADTYLEVDDWPMVSFSYKSPDMPVSFVMLKTSQGRDTSIRQRKDAFKQLEDAWQSAVGEGQDIRRAEEEFDAAEEEMRRQEAEATDESGMKNVPKGGRKLRLKKQARRTKRNARNNKRRKSRKLTTRRG